MRHASRLVVLYVFFAITVPSVPCVNTENVLDGLTSSETSVLSLVNGTEAYLHNLQLENIALSHYAFRSAGSTGASEAADWIANQFENFGLEMEKQEFQFTNWNLLSKPSLVIDDDGDPATTEDQTTIETFQSAHYSFPGEILADLVVLPLPSANNYGEIGANPIDTTVWDTIETTDKVVLIGREVRWNDNWEGVYMNKLHAEPPKAVVYTWWYDWMSFVPDFFSSAGGLPLSDFGRYYWDLEIPVGFVSYGEGLWIRDSEISIDVYASFVIESSVDIGPHYNVVGKLTGYGEPEKLVIVSGHYDTVMCGGFCDNGAGTSGVIELARVFTDAVATGLYYPKFTVLFVALASEEIGLVGSINYVMQHEAQMKDIVAVVNMDCVGNEYLHVSETDPTSDFDLDELVLEAAADLGVVVTLESGSRSDEISFRDPAWSNGFYSWAWGLDAGIGDATPVEASISLMSFPLTYRDKWEWTTPGWIHSSYDNSTSTETLNWVETDDLEEHIEVAALTVMRVSPPILIGDLNSDGVVDIFDVVTVSVAFGSELGDPEWNPDADLNNDNIVDIFDVVTVAANFGQT